MESAGFCLPLLKIYVISGTLISGQFYHRFWSTCREGGKCYQPLMMSICTHTIVLGSKRQTLNAYPCQILLAQCPEIVTAANAMDRSVGAPWMHGECMSVCSGGVSIRRTTSTSDTNTRSRPTTCFRLSRHATVVAMLLLYPENGV